MSLNLNGRIFGRTEQGLILVALTPEEYVDSLPMANAVDMASLLDVTPFAGSRPRRIISQDDPCPVEVAPRPHCNPPPEKLIVRRGRKPGKATKAQRAFNSQPFGKKAKPPKGKGPIPARECPHCKGMYVPVRRDQTYCLDKTCKAKKDLAYRELIKAGKTGKKAVVPAVAKEAAPGTGKTPPTKEQRLEAIRAAQRRVSAAHAGEGRTLRSTIPNNPPEMESAQAAARIEE